jgi:hypothetical protein
MFHKVSLKSFTKENILSSYYIDLNYFLKLSKHYTRIVYDGNSIPLFIYDAPLGLKYNPTTISLHAIVSYQAGDYLKFFKYTQWLLEHAENLHHSNRKMVFIEFPFPPRAYKPYWASGMTQGLVASTMVRAYIITGNEGYLTCAQSLIEGMLTPIDEGGCLFVEGDNVWIEEYPLEKPPKHVLNGLIFAMFGLYDVYLITQNTEYYRTFKKVFLTLEKNIKLYDLYLWSRYDVSPRNIADESYHLLNTTLVYTIAKLENSLRLTKVAKRWYAGYIILRKPLGLGLHAYSKIKILVR